MLIEFFFHSLFYLSWSHADIRLNVLSLYIFFFVILRSLQLFSMSARIVTWYNKRILFLSYFGEN